MPQLLLRWAPLFMPLVPALGVAHLDQNQPVAAPVSAPSPFLGLWLGSIGVTDDRVPLGLEIAAAPDGTLHASVTSPVLNVYSQDVGLLRVENQTGHLDAMGLSLTPEAGGLVGVLVSSTDPVRFDRVEALPVEQPIPDLPTGPGPIWRTTIGGQLHAPVEVAGNLAFIGSTNGVMTAINTADGSIAWTFSAGRPIFGQAAAHDGSVYFVCDNGYLYRLDAGTGVETWRFDLGDSRAPRILGHAQVYDHDARSPRPLIRDGVVYVGSGEGTMHAVDAATGTPRWSVPLGGRLRAAAAVDPSGGPSRVYVGSTGHHLYCLDVATGATLWAVDLRGEITTAPVLAHGLLYIGTRQSSSLLALDPATGERRWRQIMFGSWVESEPSVAGDVLYIGSSDLRRAAAYDALSGRLLWRTDVLGWSWGTPVVDGQNVYVGAAGIDPYTIRHTGGLLLLDRASGDIRWRWPAPTTPGQLQWGFLAGPTLVGDLIMAPSLDGCVYAFPAR